MTYKAYVNPKQNDLSSKHDLLISTQNLHLEITVVTDPDEKEALIEKMNLKYPFQRKTNIPLMLLEKLKVNLGDNEESDCSYEEQSSFKDIQANIDCLLNEDPLTTMAKLDTPKALDTAFDSGYEKDKVTLDWLLSSQTLYSFVKKSSQSRLLQAMISKATPNQI